MTKIFKTTLYITLVLSLLAFFGCQDRSDLTDPGKPNTGDADFTRFVTLGNSLTAGYQSGSLFESAQEYAFGKIIADQVQTNYAQIAFPEEGSAGKMSLTSLSPLNIVTDNNGSTPTNLTYQAPFNNLGVPGAFLYDIIYATNSETCYTALAGQPNPMFDAILRNIGSEFQQAKMQSPTFLTCWIGNNDILGHATNGGTIAYTSEETFNQLYYQLADSLSSICEDVVIANIPSVTSVPFFTTIPAIYQADDGTLIELWGETNEGIRKLDKDTDLLTLKAKEFLPQGYGFSVELPLPHSVVVDSNELIAIEEMVEVYNTIIANVAETYDFGLVDINGYFKSIMDGYHMNGISFSMKYIQGDDGSPSIFSLDGVHPNNFGYGIVANEFIKVINSKYGANIPLVNVGMLPGSLPIN